MSNYTVTNRISFGLVRHYTQMIRRARLGGYENLAVLATNRLNRLLRQANYDIVGIGGDL